VELDRLQSTAPSSSTAEEWIPATGEAEVPLEALAGLAEADRPSNSQPAIAIAAAPARDEDLQTARAEVEDLRRQLAESERLRREMDTFLSGMGIRIRQP
jgi:hypothetical protein